MRIENGVGDGPVYTPPISSQNQTSSKTETIQQIRPDNSHLKNQKIQNAEAIKANDERKKVDEHEVIQAIEKANKHIKVYDRRLEFSIHDATKEIMVKVIDTESDKVIREIPSEKILDMVAHLWQVAGILVDEKR